MKKMMFLLAGLITACTINAQSLEEIVKKYSTAMNYDKLSGVSTIKVSGKISAMGNEMPIVMYMKNPNKIKVTNSIAGQEIVTVFDGEKGYMINPMMGSNEPVELKGEQLTQVQNNNAFRNELQNYYKNGQLTLEGKEDVNGKSANKLKINVEGQKPVYMFLDQQSGLLVKTSTVMEQAGTSMTIDTFMSDYSETNGVKMPRKTTTMMNGMEAAVISFDNVEVNIPMDDSIFKIK